MINGWILVLAVMIIILLIAAFVSHELDKG